MLEPQKTQMEFMNEILRQVNKIKRSQIREVKHSQVRLVADADWFFSRIKFNWNSYLISLYLSAVLDP